MSGLFISDIMHQNVLCTIVIEVFYNKYDRALVKYCYFKKIVEV